MNRCFWFMLSLFLEQFLSLSTKSSLVMHIHLCIGELCRRYIPTHPNPKPPTPPHPPFNEFDRGESWFLLFRLSVSPPVIRIEPVLHASHLGLIILSTRLIKIILSTRLIKYAESLSSLKLISDELIYFMARHIMYWPSLDFNSCKVSPYIQNFTGPTHFYQKIPKDQSVSFTVSVYDLDFWHHPRPWPGIFKVQFLHRGKNGWSYWYGWKGICIYNIMDPQDDLNLLPHWTHCFIMTRTPTPTPPS